MSEAKVFIGRAKCSSCPPQKNAPFKWGMVIRIDGNEVFLCKDCLRNIVAKADEVEKIEGVKIARKRNISAKKEN